jgi:hypothetical protein
MTRLCCFGILFSLALAAGAQTPAPSPEALRMEMVFWESVRSSSDPADFKAYLEKYPQGNFAALARNRLAALGQRQGQQQGQQVQKPQVAPEKPREAAGPLAAGDSWTYRVVNVRAGTPIGTHEVRLVSAVGDNLVEEVLDSGGTRRVEHRRGFYLAPVGPYTMFSPYLLHYGAPQFGVAFRGIDNLDMRTCNAGWTCSARGRTLGWDRVRVPAGEFNAIRVEIYQNWTTPSQTNDRGESVERTLTVWYSPETKRPVKFISRGGPSANVDTEFELELVSYKVK